MHGKRTLINLVFAIVSCVGGLALLVVPPSSLPAAAQPAGHGMWVQRTATLLDNDPDASQLLGFSAPNQITELYLSVGSDVLSDARLPHFVGSLKGGGLPVDALIGCSGVSDCQTGTWRTRIEQVKDYNQGRSEANQRFDGIHLDLEPWVGTGDDFSWVPDLIGYYRDASFALQGTGLTLAADISGVKAISSQIAPADRQALLDVATRLTLLEYEVSSVDTINARVDAFRDAVDLSNAFFVIATRVQDFGATMAAKTGPSSSSSTKGMLGRWAMQVGRRSNTATIAIQIYALATAVSSVREAARNAADSGSI